MFQNEITEINALPPMEIDPDYESRIADEPDPKNQKNQPARITTKKAWFMSLFLPVLSMIAFTLPLMNGLYLLTAVFGLIGGGIVPTVMIVCGKIDTSKYFPAKMILFAVLVAVVVFSWITSSNIWTWIGEGFHFLILPISIITAELIFAATRKTDAKTKLCLVLSSAAWVCLGFTLDYTLAFLSLLF